MNGTDKTRWTAAAGLATFLLGGLAALQAAPAAKPPARVSVSRFRLPDTAGKIRTLDEFKSKRALVLVFTGTECPISNNYAEPLSRLQEKYGPQGVQFLGINANDGESIEAVARHAKDFRYSFPVLKDARQTLADQVGARVTPEAFVLDSQRVVRYRGRIDDAYASRTRKRDSASTPDLESAITAVLAGKPVPSPVTESLGCAIVRPPKRTARAAKTTYHRDVAPILQNRCQSCHRPGQVAPFSLLTFRDARSWAKEIRQFTSSRQMPPWKAEPGHGEFQDSRRLSDAEIATLAAWAEAGAPEGSLRDAPPPPKWPAGWMLGEPDLVLSMPETFAVEATGKDIFRCFVLPTNLTEDRQVVGVEIRPGNPRVVHHVLNFLDTSGQARKLDEKDPALGYNSGPGGVGFFPTGALGGWAPGNFPRFLPKGVGMPLPKGSDVVVQIHYHKTGKAETDKTRIGIYFAKEPIEKRLRTLPLTTLNIDIPPNEPRHELKTSIKLPFSATALTITPHMHLLGKEMKVTATLPDGTQKSMVWVKDWDYRWQDTYRYKEPLKLPRGTQLELVAYYDNTTSNPLNPHTPPKRVTFGEETTDEMCFAFIEFTIDTDAPAAPRAAGALSGQ